jgi:hypothetical protein
VVDRSDLLYPHWREMKHVTKLLFVLQHLDYFGVQSFHLVVLRNELEGSERLKNQLLPALVGRRLDLFFCESKPKCAIRRAFAGFIWIADRRLSSVPSLILFSIHSGTVSFEKGEIVLLLGSATLHFSNRSTGVNPEDCRSNFAAIVSRVALI